MTELSNTACPCTNCPGATCQCGCAATDQQPTLNAAGAACACGTGCGCDAAEQGCLCSAAA